MSPKEGTPGKSGKKALAHGVKRAAKALLATGRTLPRPVEIEPRQANAGAIRGLEEERQRLVDELKRQEFVGQEHPTTGNHMADDATEVSEQAKSFALRRHLEGMVKEIDRAILRAERGIYGVCERCGRPISDDRLKVVPSACLCIECAKLQARAKVVA